MVDNRVDKKTFKRVNHLNHIGKRKTKKIVK